MGKPTFDDLYCDGVVALRICGVALQMVSGGIELLNI